MPLKMCKSPLKGVRFFKDQHFDITALGEQLVPFIKNKLSLDGYSLVGRHAANREKALRVSTQTAQCDEANPRIHNIELILSVSL